MKKPLIILAGPTAVGKTKASIGLAKRIGAEIISADSMQVYKHMDIGSAKITRSEMSGISHHLIDILEPEEEFNVVRFQKMALEEMEQIYEKGKIPLIVGGTDFYIQSVLYNIDFTENEMDTAYRKSLEELAKHRGAEALHELLLQADPASAAAIHPNNIKRVIRALEYYRMHGKPISLHNQEQRQKESPYDFRYFVLNDDRENLYRRIDKRVDQMMEEGLLDEVDHLQKMGYTKDMVSMQGLGYKELFDVLDGSCSLEEGIYRIKRDTRHFAKRQLTWFHSKPEVIWINKADFSYDNAAILTYMIKNMQKEN